MLELSNKQLDVAKQLTNCVQGECKPSKATSVHISSSGQKLILYAVITQCSMEALYKLGKEHQAITDMAKNFERRRCNHRTAIDEIDCIKDVVGTYTVYGQSVKIDINLPIGPTNKHRYTMAVQSGKLRQHLRSVPGVPVIHFNDRGVMVMEMPSDATLKHKDSVRPDVRA